MSTRTTATDLLRHDHRKVEDLYRRYREAGTALERQDLAEVLCRELEIHARLEEDLVYPGLAGHREEVPLVRHCGQAHEDIKRLISEIRLADGATGLPLAREENLVPRIMAIVERHVHEEEGMAFPVLEADLADNEQLGADLARLKLKLEAFPPIHHAIDLEVPVGVAYDQWTRFRSFPQFLESVKEVEPLDDTHVAWVVEIGGRELRWTARITEQIPDRRIAWVSVDGTVNAGSASFLPLTARSCRLLVELAYEPSGLVEDLGALLGLVSRRLHAEMKMYKVYIETCARTGGAWRGRIEGKPMDPAPDGRLARGVPEDPGRD